MLVLLFTVCVARAGDVDWADPEVAVVEGKKRWGFDAVVDIDKNTGIPKKVAIGSFQIQFTMRTQDAGLDDGAYQTITDRLYDSFVASLGAHGYEVVPKSAVVASAGYALLESDMQPIGEDEKTRFAPTGMKLHATTATGGLGSTTLEIMPRLNSDLGTDSVIVVRANFGVVDVAKLKHVEGTGLHACLCDPPSLAPEKYPGLDITWLHGVRRTSRMGKAEPTPFVGIEDLVTPSGADAATLAAGASGLFDAGLYLSWVQWELAVAKKAAKLD